MTPEKAAQLTWSQALVTRGWWEIMNGKVDLEPNCHWANDGERVMGFAITVTNHFNDITVKTPYLTSAMVYLDNFLQPCKDLTTNGSG